MAILSPWYPKQAKSMHNSINLTTPRGVRNCSPAEEKQITGTFKLSIFHCVNSEALNHSFKRSFVPFLSAVLCVFEAYPGPQEKGSDTSCSKHAQINVLPVVL